jgi:hypothetical protein
MGRRLYEEVVELTSTESRRSEALRWAQRFRYNRNRARLSFGAHAFAKYRGTLVTTGRYLGITHYMCYPSFEDFAPDGLLAKHAWQIRTFDDWTRIFRELNRERRQAVPFPGLGLHYGSNELYWPVPDALLEEGRVWSKQRRAAWRVAHPPARRR